MNESSALVPWREYVLSVTCERSTSRVRHARSVRCGGAHATDATSIGVVLLTSRCAKTSQWY